ncbi:MAG: 2-oxoacid:acceptor oxidoreductase family protein, partial [Rhodospirillales bacterium]|nr:2-oxoacid:acceptor oxidoreductase family protein [Rhodospirillales bacterium]
MFKRQNKVNPKYPGKRTALDGNTAVIMCEREASDAAGAYPITPSTQMGEYWAEETAKGHVNISNKSLVFIEPESEHAAAAVTAGMSMSGLRATNFSSSQGIAFMHESLYAAAGKRLPYVLNIGCRAITKASLNVHCGHDDFHCIDDTGFFQLFACDAQGAGDLNLIGRKVAELSLTPAAIGQDGFLTTHLIEPVMVPERELVAEFLGRPDDIIECPTPAQKMIYGESRRRVPALWDVDNPMTSGVVQNQDSFMQTVAAQRPYFYDHIPAITDEVMAEFETLTGRRYQRISTYNIEKSDYVIVGMGSMIPQARTIADYLGKTRKLKIGVLDVTMYRPFPGDLISKALMGKKGVAVLERTDQPLAEDLPLIREIRAAISKSVENARTSGETPYTDYATYKDFKAIAPLYSGAYGLGSRDLQPESLIAAIENMLPTGAARKFFYLGIEFVSHAAATPKQEIYQQKLRDNYPEVENIALRGSENPDLLPEGAITVRMHSVGGWGAITTGKNLAMTLFDILGYDIKANPKYGSEKKGQPTTYYMSAAPEPIPLNCEYHHVDVVLSPDPNVFGHSNPLHGLKKNGIFIIQSSAANPEELWNSFPHSAQTYISDNKIRVFFIDGFKIAREEASDVELQLRMQGNVFQGVFFAASPLMEIAGLDEKKLFEAIADQLVYKFGSKGKRVVDDNIRVVRRGFDEAREIIEKRVGVGRPNYGKRKSNLPIMVKQIPETDGGASDIHRFWEQIGHFYATGKGDNILADPFQALSLIPASTGVFRDMTQIRFDYPDFIAEKCTACGDCYSVCPDSAIPGLVNTVNEVFATAIRDVETTNGATEYLRRESRNVEKALHPMLEDAGEEANVRALINRAIDGVLSGIDLEGEEKSKLENELSLFKKALADFRFALTKPFWTIKEKKSRGSGGLFSVTVNPYTCKGCMLCVEVCDDGALVEVTQDDSAIRRMRSEWDFWLKLPSTNKQFNRIDDIDEKIGALHTLLLDKKSYNSMVCGDGACLGCGEKSIIHLFTSTVTALMQPRVEKLLEQLNDQINRLEKHIRLKLSEGLDLSDIGTIDGIVSGDPERDLTLSDLSGKLDSDNETTVLDRRWLKRATGLMEKLRDLKWRYEEGPTKRGRTDMGIANATGCTSVWGATYPYNPYPFPWTSHLFQDSPSIAMGLFEGHMAKMADGFKAMRLTELELAGKYSEADHDVQFQKFGWKDFNEQEWLLCPPVVSIGGDGAMYDIGFQNLSRALASGMPVKVLVLDTQVYSNTGGQACTSGFISQVADMSPYGPDWKGKEEVRKEISLIGMAHRTSYVMQGAMSNLTHLLEGFIDGLNKRRPALFNIHAVCPPEHGVGDDMADKQSKRAVESRAYPLIKFDPDAGETIAECTSLDGNPAIDADWPEYSINFTHEDGRNDKLSTPMTFADFAATEGRFRKHFKHAPAEAWNDDMVSFHEFLDLDEDEREEKYPYIWGVDEDNKLVRIMCSQEIVKSAEERRSYWRQLKGIAGLSETTNVDSLVQQTKEEMAQLLSSALLNLSASGNANTFIGNIQSSGEPKGASASTMLINGKDVGSPDNHEAVWVETPECTTCDECIEIAPKIFQYNDDNQAVVINPHGGTFKNIVRSAEKCTAECIHPGTPWNTGD